MGSRSKSHKNIVSLFLFFDSPITEITVVTKQGKQEQTLTKIKASGRVSRTLQIVTTEQHFDPEVLSHANYGQPQVLVDRVLLFGQLDVVIIHTSFFVRVRPDRPLRQPRRFSASSKEHFEAIPRLGFGC